MTDNIYMTENSDFFIGNIKIIHFKRLAYWIENWWMPIWCNYIFTQYINTDKCLVKNCMNIN